MRYARGSATLAVPFLLGSCASRTFNAASTPNTLEPMACKVSGLVTNFKLGFAEKNGIAHKVFLDKVVPISPQVQPDRGSVVRVVFGPLSDPQYRLLMDHYGGQGFVPYKADRCWELQDFLPPKMQALVNHWLVPTRQDDPRIPLEWGSPYYPGEPVPSGVGMNCWTTAYEVVRDWGKPWRETPGKLSYFGPLEAEKLLWKNDAAILAKVPLARSLWEPARLAERNAGRQPGDILYITTKYSTIGPAHVAIWVDDDLYFEKTNYSAEDPIRLAFYSDVVDAYLEQDAPDRPVQMTFLRYKPGSLPPPETLAGQDPYGPTVRQLPPLAPELKSSVIFTLDLGLGGGLKEYSANRILSFPLAPSADTGRAEYQGARDIKKFFVTDNLCHVLRGSSAYEYKVTVGMELFVYNREGREVARIQGRRTGQTARKSVVAEFKSGDKVLTIMKTEHGSFTLNHPGVTDSGRPVSLECARGEQSFDK